MKIHKKILWLLPVVFSSMVIADQVINDDLIVGATSDGTAPAFDCTAGATLPLANAGDVTSPLAPLFNVGSVTATIPAGQPIVRLEIDFPTIINIGGVNVAQYNCITPSSVSSCIGQDCSNGETFNGDTLKLKENNLRIRFQDTAVTTGFGESWNLEANSSRNGGSSYFDIQVKSINKDTTRLVTAGDGPVPAYDCSVPHPFNLFDPSMQLPPSTGFVPIGQPFITPVVDLSSCTGASPNQMCNYICDPEIDFKVESVLNLGVASKNSTAIGNNSSVEANTVSVGRAALLRRIANVANAINDTDILTLERLNDYSVVEDQLAQAVLIQQTIDNLNTQIDALTIQVDIIDLDDDDDGFSDIDEGICGTSSVDPNSVPDDFDMDRLCDNGIDSDDDNDTVLDDDDAFPLDENESVDTDSDGIGNNADPDDDNDNVLDADDAFPLDKDESVDTDGDNIGNNADPDDDNDNVLDADDAFPLDKDESVDTDGDNIGNNADPDDDGDNIQDTFDVFPLDASESIDTDGDGIGNNADPDDDGDNVLDINDAFPLDSTESADSDGDGIGDNADNDNFPDPTTPAVMIDTDEDGTPDISDSDDDNDGVDDANDAFPLDSTESVDTDNDGVGNNADTDDDNDNVDDINDVFPLDSTESVDTDNDGIGNNADPDDDNDNVLDNVDAFPLNINESVDTDGDGIGNQADTDDDNDGTLDDEDDFPLDATKSSSKKGGSFNIFAIFMLLIISLIRRRSIK